MPIRWTAWPGMGAGCRRAPRTSSRARLPPARRPRDLPRVGRRSQLSGCSSLPAVLDRLAEDAVLVAQPVAHGRELQGGHRVEEAGGQPAEAAVAQAGVGLLLEHPSQSRCFCLTACARRIEQQVGDDVVGQRPADEELHREVVDPLGVLAVVGLLGLHPALREDVAHGAGDGLEPLAGAGRRRIDDVVEDEMAFIEGFRNLIGPQPYS